MLGEIPRWAGVTCHLVPSESGLPTSLYIEPGGGSVLSGGMVVLSGGGAVLSGGGAVLSGGMVVLSGGGAVLSGGGAILLQGPTGIRRVHQNIMTFLHEGGRLYQPQEYQC